MACDKPTNDGNLRAALIVGATGAIGSELLKQCLINDVYDKVIVMARKDKILEHKKLEWLSMDAKPSELLMALSSPTIDGYCSMGTTLKKSGSLENFRAIDYTLTIKMAELHKKLKVNSFSIVSSIGANATSKNYYRKTKGEVEETLKSLSFPALYIARPSVLDIPRSEFRLAEWLAIKILKALSLISIGAVKALTPIPPSKVASAMIKHALNARPGIYVLTNIELLKQ